MIWIILNIILLLALAFSFQPEEGPKKLYWVGLAIKTIASIAFGVLYMNYLHSGDTIQFHESALRLYELSEQSFKAYLSELFQAHYPVYQAEWRNEFFTKILSVPYIVTQGNYWLSAFYLMFFCYLCVWYLIRSIGRYYPKLVIPAFVAFMVLPSPVFWSSGILKDTLVNGAVFYLAGLCIRYYHNSRFPFSQVTIAIACLFLLFYLKFYLVAVVGLLMISLAWFKLANAFITSTVLKSMLSAVVILGCIYLATLANRNINLDQLPQSLFQNYSEIQQQSSASETLSLPLEPTYKSVLSNVPYSLIAGLYRPFIWEVDVLKFWFGLENLMLLMLSMISIYFVRKSRPNLLAWLAICFILILAVALPMASPNFGSLMRYKSVFLPFFAFLLLINPYLVIILKER